MCRDVNLWGWKCFAIVDHRTEQIHINMCAHYVDLPVEGGEGVFVCGYGSCVWGRCVGCPGVNEGTRQACTQPCACPRCAVCWEGGTSDVLVSSHPRPQALWSCCHLRLEQQVRERPMPFRSPVTCWGSSDKNRCCLYPNPVRTIHSTCRGRGRGRRHPM